MTNEAIKDKIRKLLSLASNEGATEHEAARAMEFASALMMKHGIERDELDTDDAPSVGYGRAFALERSYFDLLAKASGMLYGATPVFWRRDKAVRFAGRDDNVDAAEQTFHFLVAQVEVLYKRNLPKGLSKADRAQFRKGFKDTCALRVLVRAQEIVESLSTKDNEDTGSRALVIVEHRQVLESEIDEFLEKMEITKGKGRSLNLSRFGTDEGYRAGAEVKLHKEVE